MCARVRVCDTQVVLVQELERWNALVLKMYTVSLPQLTLTDFQRRQPLSGRNATCGLS